MTIAHRVRPLDKDLGGGFHVRRSLPSADVRSVGPYVFFDHFGPFDVAPGDNHDVRPHPHIGLSTLTWLFDGAMMHRDSTGVVQRIEPGAVNWMTAGRGIVHSERAPKELTTRTYAVHGLQFWVGLPAEREEDAPTFQHVPAAEVPRVSLDACTATVFVGEAFGAASPVAARSPTLGVVLDFGVATGATLTLPALATERALYAVDHPLELDGEKVDEFTLAVLEPGTTPMLAAPRGGRVVLIGGEPLGHRFMSWNFVSSRRERIRDAEDDWLAQRFPAVPGETEFIPLPPRRP